MVGRRRRGHRPARRYARSLQRGGLFELTEFFVEPTQQSKGAGRALLARAFPPHRGEVRSIIATTDVRAMARYYAAETAARFPMLTLTGAPSSAPLHGALEIVVMNATSADHHADFEAVERPVLGFARGAVELRWILEHREGYLYRRDGQPVGYAFVGKDGGGPIGALAPDDLPSLLLHVETRAHALGVERLSLQVPGVNATAVRHLVGRGFQIDAWVNLLMSNRPFGQFDRFLAFGPLFL
jgi:GNAT superfamily N-acetyltransferase